MKFNFSGIRKLLSSQPIIGGLDISEIAIRFVDIRGDKLRKTGVILSPGVVEGGRVKDKEKLLKALKELKKLLGKSSEKIFVVTSIPSHNVYTQTFSVPAVEDKQLDEAIALNLQLISPIDIKTAYFDCERLNKPITNIEKLELLGAFVNQKIVDDFVSVLEEAGFGVAAVEFSALALARVLNHGMRGVDFTKDQVALSVSGEGFNFLVLRHGRLYFNYFVPWNLVQRREIPLKVFNEILVQEMKKVLTFYGSRWDGAINDMILLTPGLVDDIQKVFAENFTNIKIKTANLGDSKGIDFPWYTALGCAVRGQVPRSDDVYISLMAVGTEEKFVDDQKIIFIRSWRNICVTSFAALLLTFVGGDQLLNRISNDLKTQISSLMVRDDNREVLILQEEAKKFNELARKAMTAKSKSTNYSNFFAELGMAAGANITFKSVTFENVNKVLVTASAVSETAAINFKNNLIEQRKVKNIVMPLSSIVLGVNGEVSFTISFEL